MESSEKIVKLVDLLKFDTKNILDIEELQKDHVYAVELNPDMFSSKDLLAEVANLISKELSDLGIKYIVYQKDAIKFYELKKGD